MSKELTDYLQQNHKQHLIFDMDRTLAKIDIDWDRWHGPIADIYEEFEPGFVYQVGDNLFARINEFIEKYGTEIRNRIWATHEKFEVENKRGFIEHPSLIEFIKNDNSYDAYLYTSNTRPTATDFLKEFNLQDKFSGVVTANDVPMLKPEPFGFELLFGAGFLAQEDKSDYLMIGDSSSDEGAAAAAGIDFFLVDYTGWD